MSQIANLYIHNAGTNYLPDKEIVNVKNCAFYIKNIILLKLSIRFNFL